MSKNIKLLLLLLLLLPLSGYAQGVYDQKITPNTDASKDEGEADIAINTTDSNKMTIGFMESSATSVVFRLYNTSDGGNTWSASTLDPLAITTGEFPGYLLAGGGDILLAYDKTGKLYCSWIYLLLPPSQNIDSCRWVSYWAYSTDNGNTFSLEPGNSHFWGQGILNPFSDAIANYADGICDRNWLACDLTNGPHANNLYVGYINYTPDIQNSGLRVKVLAPASTTFSAPNLAYAGSGQLTNIKVDGNGVVHYTFVDISQNKLYHVSSSDGGQTFSSPDLIATGSSYFPQSGFKVNNRENAAPSLAIDGSNNLFIVWNDYTSAPMPVGYYSKSLDNGITWSTPIDLSTIFGGAVFMPTVSAKGNRVVISANVLDSTKKSQYFIAISTDNGATFSPPVKVSSGITDYGTMNMAAFVGDYSTSVRTGCQVFNCWTDGRANGQKEYISRYNDCNLAVREVTTVNSAIYLENIYPNPSSGNVSIVIKSSSQSGITISLYDITGKEVMHKAVTASVGSNTFNVDVSHLAAGNYVVGIKDKDNDLISRVITKK